MSGIRPASKYTKHAMRMKRNYSKWPRLAFIYSGLSAVVWLLAGIVPSVNTHTSSTAVGGSRSSFSKNQRVCRERVKISKIDSTNSTKRSCEKLRAAFLRAQRVLDPMQQQSAFDRCMEGLTSEMAATLLAEMNPQDLNGTAAQRLFDHWASANPTEAAAWAQVQGDLDLRQSLMNVAALRWAVVDLKGATTWVRNLPDGDLRTAIIAAIGGEALRADPVEALRLAAELPDSQAQTDLVCRAAAEWAVTDQNSVLDWSRKIEDEHLQQRVTEQIVVATVEQDPLASAHHALQLLPEGMVQDRALVSIVQRWVQTDPAAVSAWVSQFPEDKLGVDVITNVVSLWANNDLPASGDWLMKLPAGVLRDAGILSYVRVLERTDADLAERWTASMTHGLQPAATD